MEGSERIWGGRKREGGRFALAPDGISHANAMHYGGTCVVLSRSSEVQNARRRKTTAGGRETAWPNPIKRFS